MLTNRERLPAVVLIAVCLAVLIAPPAAAQQPAATPDPSPVIARLDGHDLAIAQLKAEVEALKARLTTPPPARVVASAAVAPVVTPPPVPVRITQASFSGIVPPGMHAHRRVDGSVFVHSHANLNDPAAHAGVAPPWVQIAQAGEYVPPQPVAGFAPAAVTGAVTYQPVPAFGTFSTVTHSSGSFGGCPGGVCPAQQSSPGLFGRVFGR